MLFPVGGGDRSMKYLGLIFGGMGDLPLGADVTSPVVKDMVLIFNQVIFSLAIFIIVYTFFVSIINTAQEGEVLGKRWSTVWVPARAAMGLFLLLPTTSGYSWIQLTVMWFIVQGVGAANAIWNEVVKSWQSEGQFHTDTRQADLTDTNKLVQNILASTHCVQLLNMNIDASIVKADRYATIWREGKYINFGIPPSTLPTPPSAAIVTTGGTAPTTATTGTTPTAQNDAAIAKMDRSIEGINKIITDNFTNLTNSNLLISKLKLEYIAARAAAIQAMQVETALALLPNATEKQKEDARIASENALARAQNVSLSLKREEAWNKKLLEVQKTVADANTKAAVLKVQLATMKAWLATNQPQAAIKNLQDQININMTAFDSVVRTLDDLLVGN